MDNTLKEKRKELNAKNVNLLQKNLVLIRKTAGWTAEDLADKIGVTKPTILNIEKEENPTPMSTPIYIAIMTVLADTIEEREENDILRSVLGLIFESEELSDDNREDALAYISGLKIKEKNAKNIKIDNAKTDKKLRLILGGVAAATITGAALIAKALLKSKL